MAADGGLYYLARGGGGELLKISFTQSTAPTITQQPQNQTATQGQSATFSVTASGTAPLAYQWQRNNGTGGAFVNISGATSRTFTLSNAQPADNGAQFRVVVSNSGGPATSSAATLTVTTNQTPSPTITITGGLRNGKFDAGTPISFSLAATDPEDGTEPASRFTYQVDYVTSLNSPPGGVVRPFVPATSGQASGTFTPAVSGPYTLTNVVYRVTFTVTEGDAAHITEIRIVGNKVFSQSELLGLFDLTTGGWLTWYTKSDRYSRQKGLSASRATSARLIPRSRSIPSSSVSSMRRWRERS